MEHNPIRRADKIRDMNILPYELIKIICGYADDDSDCLEQLLTDQTKYKLDVELGYARISIIWSATPADFKQKKYRVSIKSNMLPSENGNDEDMLAYMPMGDTSRSSFAFKHILPDEQAKPGNKMWWSFYPGPTGVDARRPGFRDRGNGYHRAYAADFRCAITAMLSRYRE